MRDRLIAFGCAALTVGLLAVVAAAVMGVWRWR